MTDVLRLVGNRGAHANEEDVAAWEVAAIDEFFLAVVEYVYVAPAKLEAFRKELERLDAKRKDPASAATVEVTGL